MNDVREEIHAKYGSAKLIEGAVRSTILLLRGIDSMQEFIDRQQRALENPDLSD